MTIPNQCVGRISNRFVNFARPSLLSLSLLAGSECCFQAQAAPEFLLDMTHANPGEGYPNSQFVNPKFLAGWGYNGQVIGSIGGIQTLVQLAPGLIAEGRVERDWAMKRAESVRQHVRAAHAAGIHCFAGTDRFLFPSQLITRFKAGICDDKGRIDVDRPKTKEIFRALLRETCQCVPEMDGCVVPTGEVYLQDYPCHAAGGSFCDGAEQDAAVRERQRQDSATAIARYDALWEEWRWLEQGHPCCASIYKDVGFDHHPGIGAAINRYREMPETKQWRAKDSIVQAGAVQRLE
jgi:hypothetical protein